MVTADGNQMATPKTVAIFASPETDAARGVERTWPGGVRDGRITPGSLGCRRVGRHRDARRLRRRWDNGFRAARVNAERRASPDDEFERRLALRNWRMQRHVCTLVSER